MAWSLSYHGTHQLSSVLVLSRHASETWSLDWDSDDKLEKYYEEIGAWHSSFADLVRSRWEESTCPVHGRRRRPMPGGRYDRTRVSWNAYKAYYRYWSRQGGKVIGSLMWTRTKSREPNTLGICWGLRQGPNGFDLQHHDFYSSTTSCQYRRWYASVYPVSYWELNSSLYENCCVKSPVRTSEVVISGIWTLYLSLLPHGLKIDSIASQPLLSLYRWSHNCTTRFPRKSSKTSYISIPATHGFHVTMCKFTDGVTHLYVPISSLFWHCLKTRQFESDGLILFISSTPPLSLNRVWRLCHGPGLSVETISVSTYMCIFT
jgi:hypothetical protein